MINRIKSTAASKIIAKLGPRLKNAVAPDYDFVDAPLLLGKEAYIPTGDTVAIVPDFHPARSREPIATVRLGEATVTGSEGWIRQCGLWLMQFSWYGGQSFLSPSFQEPPVAPKAIERTYRIDGETVTTIPCFEQVYGHVLLDEMPLLLFLLQDGLFREFDTILCSGLATKLLKRLDHPDLSQLLDRVKIAERDTEYHLASLTALHRNGCKTNPSREEINLLRAAAPPVEGAEGSPKRIFLTRGSETRSIKNMAEVSEVLRDHGVAEVSAAAHPNPWALFANAELEVGVAGSDLSDSVFMTPGASLLEIHPSDHVRTYNWNVAQTLGLAYHSMIAPSETMRNTTIGVGNSPIHAPIERLAAMLEDIG